MKRYALVMLLVLAGVVLPVSNSAAAGWHTIFYDNFATAAAKGRFPGPVYGPKWRAWNTDRDGRAWLGVASLLWPDSNVWGDGEVDWPEIYGGTSPNVLGDNHCVTATGRQAWEKCGVNVNTLRPWLNTWHETSVSCSPSKLELWMDGKLYATTSGVNVPTAALHQVIQSGSASWTAPCPSCAVKINIDVVRIDRYVP